MDFLISIPVIIIIIALSLAGIVLSVIIMTPINFIREVSSSIREFSTSMKTNITNKFLWGITKFVLVILVLAIIGGAVFGFLVLFGVIVF